MHGMFMQARAFNGNLSRWDVSILINMDNMFTGATRFKHSDFDVNTLFMCTKHKHTLNSICNASSNQSLQKNIYKFLQVIIKQLSIARTDIYLF